MQTSRPELEDAKELYSQYVAPLEPDHKGEFAAVSKDGKVVLAPTLLDAIDRAKVTPALLEANRPRIGPGRPGRIPSMWSYSTASAYWTEPAS
jgi:hypothetical protein